MKRSTENIFEASGELCYLSFSVTVDFDIALSGLSRGNPKYIYESIKLPYTSLAEGGGLDKSLGCLYNIQFLK
jgi:hypothetical protein